MTDINATVAELRRLLEVATPGEWQITGAYQHLIDIVGSDPQDPRTIIMEAWASSAIAAADRTTNAALCVASHNALPALLDELERQAAEIERLRAENAQLRTQRDGARIRGDVLESMLASSEGSADNLAAGRDRLTAENAALRQWQDDAREVARAYVQCYEDGNWHYEPTPNDLLQDRGVDDRLRALAEGEEVGK